MSIPNIGIKVDPSEAGTAHYLPLAATTAGGTTMIKLVLHLRLENKGSSALKVKDITFSFPGSSHADWAMQGVNMDGSLDLDVGETADWSNGVVDLDPDPDIKDVVNNSVYLSGAAPSQVKIDVMCQSFTSPATITLPLAAHKSPVPEGAWRFPYAAGELRTNEYYKASAVHWPNGGAKGTQISAHEIGDYKANAVHWANGGAKGTQIFAHDIEVVGWDSNSKKWSGLLPGGSGSRNEDYRIWNKPVRAVADGTVEDWADGMDDNTVVGEFPDPTPSPAGGNSITIMHGTELVKYCHFRKGSMPEELKTKGTKVSEGQMLGRAGNTGNSPNPHTHIQSVLASDSSLRPLPFRSGWVIDRSKLSPPGGDGPWFHLAGHGICKDAVAIWPASTAPGFPVPTLGISMGGDWANSFWISHDLANFQTTAQELFDQKGRRLIRATTFLEDGKRRWAGIARAGDWANRFWVSPDLSSFQKTAQELFDEEKLRLSYVSTYVEGGKRMWVGIARGGDWANRLTITSDLASFSKQAQALFDDHGLRLIHVNTWVEDGKHHWFGISRSGNWANRWWISPDAGHFRTQAQQLFDDEGKRLVHVTTYMEGNQRRWVGISRSGTWASRWIFRSDLDSFRLEAQRLFDDEHLRLVHVEMLE